MMMIIMRMTLKIMVMIATIIHQLKHIKLKNGNRHSRNVDEADQERYVILSTFNCPMVRKENAPIGEMERFSSVHIVLKNSLAAHMLMFTYEKAMGSNAPFAIRS